MLSSLLSISSSLLDMNSSFLDTNYSSSDLYHSSVDTRKMEVIVINDFRLPDAESVTTYN